MSVRGVFLSMMFMPALLSGLNPGCAAMASDGISLYTPYTKISVPPGESINYTIDVLNNGSSVKDATLMVTGLPAGWDYTIKAGGWNIRQVSVLPGGKQSVILTVQVPLKVDKGNYTFRVVAGGLGALPLSVNVSEQGTYKTEFTSDQVNMEGNSKSTFTFRTKLSNQTDSKQLYSLRSLAMRGWNVTFKPDYKEATSVEIEPNASKDITVEVKAPETIEAGTYHIPVRAMTNTTSASLELEAVITGTYQMEFTTPTGLLSTSIKAGDERRLPLIIRNTGSAALDDIALHASAPVNWSVIFEPQKIDKLDAGKSLQVLATVKADKKAIAGDYETTLTAVTPEVSSKAIFRVSVRTPLLWGWIGVIIIILAIGSVYSLFRKYGRR